MVIKSIPLKIQPPDSLVVVLNNQYLGLDISIYSVLDVPNHMGRILDTTYVATSLFDWAGVPLLKSRLNSNNVQQFYIFL